MRQAEWRALCADLERSGAGEGLLELRADEQGYRLQGTEFDVRIGSGELKECVQEYIDIVRQLAREDMGGGVARLEALDMAKKVVHDRAGRIVRKSFRPVRIELEVARKIFSLLIALRIDTTKLVGIHGHRTIR